VEVTENYYRSSFLRLWPCLTFTSKAKVCQPHATLTYALQLLDRAAMIDLAKRSNLWQIIVIYEQLMFYNKVPCHWLVCDKDLQKFSEEKMTIPCGFNVFKNKPTITPLTLFQ